MHIRVADALLTVDAPFYSQGNWLSREWPRVTQLFILLVPVFGYILGSFGNFSKIPMPGSQPHTFWLTWSGLQPGHQHSENLPGWLTCSQAESHLSGWWDKPAFLMLQSGRPFTPRMNTRSEMVFSLPEFSPSCITHFISMAFTPITTCFPHWHVLKGRTFVCLVPC